MSVDKRYQGIIEARAFIVALLDPEKTVGVPHSLRCQAFEILCNFPPSWEIESMLAPNPTASPGKIVFANTPCKHRSVQIATFEGKTGTRCDTCGLLNV